MTDVRIVCTHDAAKLAETLTRLLEAEQHRVRLSIGRQSLSELEEARTTRDAVLLIWSPDARSQIYMIEWANKIDPLRLVEVGLTTDYPRVSRKAPVTDFTHWRGERSAAWGALNERLRAVARVLDPPKPPPKYAALALGLASAAAVSGALVLRMHDTSLGPTTEASSQEQLLVAGDPSTGLGGPLSTLEPASLDDSVLRFRPVAVVEPMRSRTRVLYAVPDVTPLELRDETFLERLTSLNPLRQQNEQN